MNTTPVKKMQIVGAQRVIAADAPNEEYLGFYGPLFGRLTSEVQHTGSLTRYIGYESQLNDRERLHFFGIEVERIGDVPHRMVAWELTLQDRTTLECGEGRNVEVSRDEITWEWLNEGSESGGRWTGEFTTDDSQLFMLTANAYVAPGGPQAGDGVVLEDYDPTWVDRYSELKQHLESLLPGQVVRSIEHIGSTSIVDMPAKPVIDILITVPSLPEARRDVVPLFNRDTYEYWWYKDHMVLIGRESFQGRRLHHLHFVEQGLEEDERIAFRDHLRSNARDAKRYAALKRELSASFKTDRERYTEAKSAFVKEVVAKARGTA